MEKFRFILAILFMAEVVTGIMHIVIGVLMKHEFPLFMYIVMPITVLGCILLCYILTPILNWIIGI